MKVNDYRFWKGRIETAPANSRGAFDQFVQDQRPMAQEPRNMYAQGQLVQPNNDGSRPGYQGDNKYTSSKGTPGVKLDAKQIKNVQDDLVNFDGLSLTKKGNSYYIRFRLQKGKNKISKQVTATPENIALVKKEQKQFMKTNYPNVLSSANFENLRMQETNINLSAKDFAEVLNNKNKTTINGLPWTKDTVQKLQGDLKLNSYVQPEGASGKLRPINDAKKIVRGFNPEELKRLNQIPDINLRNAAIRNKASSITGRTNYIKKTGTLQGITKNNQGSLWKNFYESSKKNNRIVLGGTFNGKDLSFRKNWPKKTDGTIDWFIKDKKTNKPAWKMLEFTDTQTPKGQTTFTYEGLQNQVDDAFGKGYFARSTNVYSKSRELYGKNIMFEGKMQPVGRVIAKQKTINDFKKNNNGKMPTEEYINKRITTSTPTQVHHTKGIGSDPYSVQLVSRDANQKLNAAELTYTSELKKTKGDPLKIKTLNDNFKKTINQISDTYGGIQYDVDGSVVGKKATAETAYTSAIQESGMPKKQSRALFSFMKRNSIKCNLANGINCGRPEAYVKSINELKAKTAAGDKAAAKKLVEVTKGMSKGGKLLRSLIGPGAILTEPVYEGVVAANKVLDGKPLNQAWAESYLSYLDSERVDPKTLEREEMLYRQIEGPERKVKGGQGTVTDKINIDAGGASKLRPLFAAEDTMAAFEKAKKEKRRGEFISRKDIENKAAADIRDMRKTGSINFAQQTINDPVTQEALSKAQEYIAAKRGAASSIPQSAMADERRLRDRMNAEGILTIQDAKNELKNIGDYYGQGYTPYGLNKLYEDAEMQNPGFGIEKVGPRTGKYNQAQGLQDYLDSMRMQQIADAGGVANMAGGGIAGLSGGDKSGPPPESGPASQGLRSLIKNGNKL